MRSFVLVALVSVAMAALAACSRSKEDAKPPVDAAAPDVVSVSVSVADAAAPPARLGEGSHDYRGTLDKSAVSMHLGKLGLKVSGAYFYDRFGKAIRLDGTIDEDGTITLDEFIDPSGFGSVTGHIALHSEGRNLVGTWTDAARKKTLPLTLEPSTATTALYIDAGNAPGPSRQGEQCLEDLACAASEAERLFLAADESHDQFFDCSRFIDGVGVKKDPARGRACFDRTAGKEKCNGSSPDATMAELASIRIDGIGGPRDIAGARALMASCFDDVTVQGLRERASLVEANPSTPPIDFCTDIGGTTMVFTDCMARQNAHARDRSRILAKTIVAGLDEQGRTLFRAATKAFMDYELREGALILFEYAGGSIRFGMSLARDKVLEDDHGEDLSAFGTFSAPAVSAEDLAEAKTLLGKMDVDTTPTTTTADDNAELVEQYKNTRVAYAEAHKAWLAYRNAEIALYTHVFGKAQGVPKVRDAVLLRLIKRRTKSIDAKQH